MPSSTSRCSGVLRDLSLPVGIAVEIAGRLELESPRKRERSLVLGMDQQRCHTPVGVVGEVLQQQPHGARRIPVSARLGCEPVPDVDLVGQQPRAIVIPVDPTDDRSVDHHARGRPRMRIAVAEEPPEHFVATSDEHRHLGLRWCPQSDDTVAAFGERRRRRCHSTMMPRRHLRSHADYLGCR